MSPTPIKQRAVILGATRGLGSELAAQYRRQGWQTVELGSTATNARSEESISIQCDLSLRASVAKAMESLNKIERIDRFYWVAGKMLRGPFAEYSDAAIEELIDVNFRNAVIIARGVFERLERLRSPAKFVVIASSAGKTPKAGESLYVATKFAQVGLVRSLGLENRNPDLHISLVLPGGMKTELWRDYPTDAYEGFLDPGAVASHIVSAVESGDHPFQEFDIPRGSL